MFIKTTGFCDQWNEEAKIIRDELIISVENIESIAYDEVDDNEKRIHKTILVSYFNGSTYSITENISLEDFLNKVNKALKNKKNTTTIMPKKIKRIETKTIV